MLASRPGNLSGCYAPGDACSAAGQQQPRRVVTYFVTVMCWRPRWAKSRFSQARQEWVESPCDSIRDDSQSFVALECSSLKWSGEKPDIPVFSGLI